MKHQNKESQETLTHLLNQIKNTNQKIDGMGQKNDPLPKFFMPLKTGRDNRKMIKDVGRFRSLTTDTVTPSDIPPIPDKLPGDFF